MTCSPFSDNKCLDFCDKRAMITAEEKGKKYIGHNISGKLFSRFRVDGCLIKEGKKCDFLILDCEEKKAYFIELKGKDILNALEQIDRSIEVLFSKLNDFNINARIVLSKLNPPDLRSSKYIKLERKLKRWKGTILKKARVLEENL
jgi:hypothetical protein